MNFQILRQLFARKSHLHNDYVTYDALQGILQGARVTPSDEAIYVQVIKGGFAQAIPANVWTEISFETIFVAQGAHGYELANNGLRETGGNFGLWLFVLEVALDTSIPVNLRGRINGIVSTLDIFIAKSDTFAVSWLVRVEELGAKLHTVEIKQASAVSVLTDPEFTSFSGVRLGSSFTA